jgi:hypothetical protein
MILTSPIEKKKYRKPPNDMQRSYLMIHHFVTADRVIQPKVIIDIIISLLVKRFKRTVEYLK